MRCDGIYAYVNKHPTVCAMLQVICIHGSPMQKAPTQLRIEALVTVIETI